MAEIQTQCLIVYYIHFSFQAGEHVIQIITEPHNMTTGSIDISNEQNTGSTTASGDSRVVNITPVENNVTSVDGGHQTTIQEQRAVIATSLHDNTGLPHMVANACITNLCGHKWPSQLYATSVAILVT